MLLNCRYYLKHIFIVSRRLSFEFIPTTSYSNMTSTLGVPVKLLHEALGHVITVELKTGQLYRGKLAEGLVNLVNIR